MDMPVACHLSNRTACFYPKLAFHADNGTAECAAAGRYTGKIWMMKAVNSKYNHVPTWQTATTAMQFNSYPAAFSAVCWYTGKSLFEQLGGSTPVGLLQTSVGGSPIEYWLPPEAKSTRPIVNVNACERDVPQCDSQYNDSFFFTDIVEQFTPYTIGSLVWDQAERDVKCPVATAAYACMQRLLIQTWRRASRSRSAPSGDRLSDSFPPGAQQVHSHAALAPAAALAAHVLPRAVRHRTELSPVSTVCCC